MLRKAKNRLRDILIRTEHLSKIRQQINSKEDLEKNIYLNDSAERSIEIIGEAVKNLPASIRQLSPNTPWKAIAGMRDNIIHDYNDVDYDIVWKVINIDAPALDKETTKIINHLNREEYLEYKKSLTTKPPSQSYLIRTKQQEELDIAIAKTIIKEYPVKFQHVAIAEVKDIIGASDRALELNTNSENITCSEYVAKIVALSVSKSTEKQSNNLDRD
jgi:uncharacterized protein with HEPN domain